MTESFQGLLPFSTPFHTLPYSSTLFQKALFHYHSRSLRLFRKIDPLKTNIGGCRQTGGKALSELLKNKESGVSKGIQKGIRKSLHHISLTPSARSDDGIAHGAVICIYSLVGLPSIQHKGLVRWHIFRFSPG